MPMRRSRVRIRQVWSRLLGRTLTQSRLDVRQDSSERADVSLVEVEEGVGEILDRLVGVDVGHGRG